MGGACFAGGGKLMECLIEGERLHNRFSKLIDFCIKDNLVSIHEYNPQTIQARVILCNKDNGKICHEEVIGNVSEEYTVALASGGLA